MIIIPHNVSVGWKHVEEGCVMFQACTEIVIRITILHHPFFSRNGFNSDTPSLASCSSPYIKTFSIVQFFFLSFLSSTPQQHFWKSHDHASLPYFETLPALSFLGFLTVAMLMIPVLLTDIQVLYARYGIFLWNVISIREYYEKTRPFYISLLLYNEARSSKPPG